jgi:outer membrane autotransporter protein
VSGNVTGPITIPVNLSTGASNVINVGGSTAGASANLTGYLQNPGNLVWTAPNHTLTYSNASIPLGSQGLQTLYALSSQPFSYFSYIPTAGNNGILQTLKLGAVAAPASQIASIMTALNTSFFQNAQAFLGVPVNPTPNLLYGGVWSRAGGAAITVNTTASGGGSPTSLASHSLNDLGGFQFGIDEGLYNINNSKMNINLGLTAGEAFASSTDQFPGTAFEGPIGVSSNAHVPFYGVYAALTGNGLAATFQWRHNIFGLNLNDQYLGGNGSRSVNASGNTYSADVGYNFTFGDGYTVTPSAAVFVTRTDVDNLVVPSLVPGEPSSVFSFAPLNSTLGRFGARLVKPFELNDNLILLPYATVNVWHEFQGGTTTYLNQAAAFAAPVYTTSVGTFGQLSLGFSTQSPKSGFTTYLQADLRVGSNLQGWGVIGGLRYSY